MRDIDAAIAVRRAIEKVQWASVGVVRHPTAECAVYNRGDCTCGLWAALDLLRESEFYRLLRGDRGEYPR